MILEFGWISGGVLVLNARPTRPHLDCRSLSWKFLPQPPMVAGATWLPLHEAIEMNDLLQRTRSRMIESNTREMNCWVMEAQLTRDEWLGDEDSVAVLKMIDQFTKFTWHGTNCLVMGIDWLGIEAWVIGLRLLCSRWLTNWRSLQDSRWIAGSWESIYLWMCEWWRFSCRAQDYWLIDKIRLTRD